MKILLGYRADKLAYTPDDAGLYYDTQQLINGHMILSGKSGAGKTHKLKQILELIKNETQHIKNEKGLPKVRVHVLDVHGDIDISGASTVKFSESTDYGFNPLVIHDDPDFGGVRKRIQSFISSLNRTGFKLGSNQEAVLRNLLLDLYARNGFFEKDARTWSIAGTHRKNPTIEDLARFTQAKMRGLFFGVSGNNECVNALTKVNKIQRKLTSKLKALNGAKNDEVDEIQAELDKAKEQAITEYTNYINNIENGRELDDLLNYNSFDVLKSVSTKIDNLTSIGIFKNKKPHFDPQNPIWRYDIKSLDMDEKKLFVSFLCEQLFYRSVARGLQDDVVEIIVLDEAHLFTDDDPRNPINTIAKEARKFGLALIAASQSPTHFTEDFLSNVSTKIILGIDEIYWKMATNKLKISEEQLSWIIFHKRILIQTINKGDAKSEFLKVYNEKVTFRKK